MVLLSMKKDGTYQAIPGINTVFTISIKDMS